MLPCLLDCGLGVCCHQRGLQYVTRAVSKPRRCLAIKAYLAALCRLIGHRNFSITKKWRLQVSPSQIALNDLCAMEYCSGHGVSPIGGNSGCPWISLSTEWHRD